LPETFVTRDGAKLLCRVEGAGQPALLFQHGGMVDHTTWDEHLAHFAPRHRVVAPDLRGHGRSDRAESYTTRLFRDDMVAIIQQLELAPVVIVGASRGGAIGCQVAADFPDLVKALILVDYGAAPKQGDDAPWKPPEAELRGQIESLAAEWRERGADKLVDSWFPEPDVSPALKQRLAGLCRNQPPELLLKLRLRDLEDTEVDQTLRRVGRPTLVLQSDTGRHQGKHQGQYIHQRIAGSKLSYFEGRGHGFFMSAPEEFWSRVEAFLATI
jgi:pimeloyl-ACP methyl ester carboxylesterase